MYRVLSQGTGRQEKKLRSRPGSKASMLGAPFCSREEGQGAPVHMSLPGGEKGGRRSRPGLRLHTVHFWGQRLREVGGRGRTHCRPSKPFFLQGGGAAVVLAGQQLDGEEKGRLRAKGVGDGQKGQLQGTWVQC